MFLHWNSNYGRSPELGCTIYTPFVEKALVARTIHGRWTSYWAGQARVAHAFIPLKLKVALYLPNSLCSLTHIYTRRLSKAHLKVQHDLVSTSCFLLLTCFFFGAATGFPTLLFLHFLLLVFKVFFPSILSMPFFIWTLPVIFSCLLHSLWILDSHLEPFILISLYRSAKLSSSFFLKPLVQVFFLNVSLSCPLFHFICKAVTSF